MNGAAFDPDRTRMARRMADGHFLRLGHELAGYYVPTADDGIVRLVRTCCGEESAECARHAVRHVLES